VVSDCSSLLKNRKKYFPNLQLGLTIRNEDMSKKTGFSGELLVAGAVTRERLNQF
jgi:hypothetical protein